MTLSVPGETSGCDGGIWDQRIADVECPELLVDIPGDDRCSHTSPRIVNFRSRPEALRNDAPKRNLDKA